jgi:PAS domain S-box-containing protein
MKIPIVKYIRSVSRASCLALALSFFAPGMLYATHTNQIFILHSYSQEYPWSQGQHEGFIHTLEADVQAEPLVSTEYLDTKRRAYDEAYASELARHLRLKYAGYKPAAIYVTDDNALLFARDHLSRVFPGVPVFFSGVNDYGVQSSLDPALFTGVFERKEVSPNIEWLLRIDKDANDLVFIGDGSNTDQAIENELRRELIPYRLRVTFIAEKRLDRALARLQVLPGKYIFLTTLGGMTDENDHVLPLRDIVKSLAHTGRVVISMEDAYIIEGVLGGYVTSGQKQGMNAARLFLAYQHGKPIVDLPPILKSPNALIFDDRVLKQHGIDLPENLRSQAVLLNPRLGFYDQYRSLILGMLIGLAALLFLVATLSLVILSRKNRELSLSRNSAESANALFNQLAEQSRTVHWEVNAEGVYTYVSPVSYAVLGSRPEELVDKKRFYDFLHEDERDPRKTAAFEFFVRKEPFHDLENIIRTKDGRLIWVSTNGVPVLDDHGTFLGYRGSYSEITGRKRVEEDLRESEEMFRSLIDNAPDAIYVHADARFIYLNQVAVNLFGAITADQLIGSPIMERIDPSYHEMIRERHRILYEEHRKLPIYEQLYLRLDGSSVRVEAHAVPIIYGNRNAALAFVRDITDRERAEEEKRSLEERLNRAEKMEALGILAGGVAHDLNNVLGIIVGYSELLLYKTESSAIRPQLGEIMKGGQRAAAIVQDLLTLARRGVPGRDVVNLNRIIADFQKLPEFQHLSSYHSAVKIKIELEPELPNIPGSSVHLCKTLFNLVSNASEAMPKGGILTIKTANQYLDKQIQGYDEVREGDYVVLSVSDTGEGIPAADLKRIFEPFYTKKVMGRSGTGLGLAVVWGTVKDHHGYINVQSEEGKGSTFTLYFPVTREEISAEHEEISLSEYKGKGESILIVDDVKEQRDLATEMLKKLNYDVWSVASGEEAVVYLKDHPCDLMLLDMIMDPGMDGLDTYNKVLEICPKQKAIIVSGFSESNRVHAAQALGAGAYVRKPYVLEKLGLAVRKELDRTE